jgi:ABC-2 type transport system ATP-binding protein
MQSPEISVEAKNLTCKFGDFVAVDNISFDVKKGEIFGFLGPNGAGKSTTIRMLCGILTPTGGSGSVGGMPLGGDSGKIKSIIGYMSQKFSLYQDLTVFENLDFYSGVYAMDHFSRRDRINEALKTCGLTDRRDIVTEILPAGLKQRLALACALLHQPKILFLDEPTAGVDPLSRRRFWDLIYQLSGSGVTVFVTTHYMDEAEHCDRIAFINEGKIIKIGSPEHLRDMGAKLLEVDCKDWARAFELLSLKDDEFGEAALFSTRIHLEPKPQAAEKISSYLSREGCEPLSIREIEPSLEDIFVNLLRPDKK